MCRRVAKHLSLALPCLALGMMLCSCYGRVDDETKTVLNASGEFDIRWPPSDLIRQADQSCEPLLRWRTSIALNMKLNPFALPK